MSIRRTYPTTSTRLGLYFAIFTSALISLVVLLVLLEQLGTSQGNISLILAVVLMVLVVALGLTAASNDVHANFVSSRSIPASFNGFAICLSSFGASGIALILGSLFFFGISALPLILAWITALLTIALCFAPYLRKMGAFTVPGYFSFRFHNRTLRLLTVLALVPPALLLLTAELKLALFSAAIIFDMPSTTFFVIMGTVLLASILGGGAQSLSWILSAILILVLVGLLIPLTIVSTIETNLPFGQLTYGTLFDDLVGLERVSGLNSAQSSSFGFQIPIPDLQAIQSSFVSSLNATSFVLVIICIATGIATLPILLGRASMTIDVYDSRKSYAWALFLAAVLLLSMPAYAVFSKYLVMENLVRQNIDLLPASLTLLVDSNLLELRDANQNGRLEVDEILIRRDGVFLILPALSNLPFSVVALAVMALMGAAFAGASAQISTISKMIADDVLYGLSWAPGPSKNRVLILRIMMCLITVITIWFLVPLKFDPLKLFLWAVSLTGATLFPALVLSIWWSRFNAFGALVSILTGFGVTAFYIWTTELTGSPVFFDLENILAGILGLPLGFAAGIVATIVTPRPSTSVLEVLDDVRVPGGETLYDRAHRLAPRHKSTQSA